MSRNNAFSEFERKGWNTTAGVYDVHFGHRTSKYADPLLDLAAVGANSDVLDLACGPGYLSAAAHERGSHVVGVDFAGEMVKEAQKRYPALSFQSGDAEDLSFEDNRFDAVVMGFGMLHLAHPEAAASEAYRVLKTNGRFAFSVWGNPDEVCRGTGIINKAIQDHANLDLGLPNGPPVFRFADYTEAERLLTEAGFSDVVIKRVDQAWLLQEASELLTIFQKAGVRAGEVLRAQTDSALEAIREQVIRDVETFRTGDQFRVPMGAVISSGKKTG